MNKNREKIKKIVGLSILAALVIVLQLISNYIPIGTVNITLALIPIVVGSIIYGPTGGLFLGLVMGAVVCTGPLTMTFMSFSAIGTIFVCLAKSGVAGFVAGVIYKVLSEKKKTLAIVLASISVPIINTLLFTVASFTIFLPLVQGEAVKNNIDAVTLVFLGYIGFNFIIEFVINSVLSPAVIRIVEIFKSRNN